MKTKRQIGAVLLTLSLVMFAEGCRKKGPAPPPPPKPAAPEPTKAPPPKPVITSLTVDPSSIERGQSATLRWSSQNATSGTIDNGIGSVDPNGSRQVSPSSTTTYKLTVTGEGGEATQSVTLRVTEPAPPPPPTPPAAKKSIRELVEQMIKDAYFDYDKSDIREDARNQLQQNADALKTILQQTSGTVVIEGHCDERGSAEYNLGLGDRRSTAARDFLVQLGVPADRLRVVSYGKERPQCTESNESCWQKNRRAHFVGVE